VVKREDGCWEWTGSRNSKGYGWFWNGTKNVRAHRWHYEQVMGLVPDGMQLAHTCNNTWCVRIDHLRISTARANIFDKFVDYTHCKKGHELTGTRNGKHGHPVRYCTECARERDKRRDRRKQ
jgi:hypothetical protein